MNNHVSVPTSLSITRWAYSKSKENILPEWDEQITVIGNADLLLTLASDENCPRRAAILRCLYSLVGISASKHIDVEMIKIKELLVRAQSSSDRVIVNWVDRSRIILHDLRKYDYTQWCKGGFSESDLPAVL